MRCRDVSIERLVSPHAWQIRSDCNGRGDGRRSNDLDEQIAKRVQAGKKIDIQRFASPDTYEPCHLPFIARDVAEDPQTLQAALAVARKPDVLLVGATPGLAQQAVSINMVVDVSRNRVLLEINPDAAKHANLAVDPRLYRLPGVKIIRDGNL